MRVRTWIAIGVGAVVVVALAALSVWSFYRGPEEPTDAAGNPIPWKVGSEVERHDLDPLTSRFAFLSDATEATWYSGVYGSSRGAIGPSTFWIDAVVRVPPSLIDDWNEAYDFESVELPAGTVTQALIPALPAGPLLHSDALDRDLAVGDWWPRVFVAPDGGQIVVVAISN